MSRDIANECDQLLAAKDATITQLRSALALLGAECNKARTAFVQLQDRYDWIRIADCPGHGLFGGEKIDALLAARLATDSSPTAAAAVKGST